MAFRVTTTPAKRGQPTEGGIKLPDPQVCRGLRLAELRDPGLDS